MNPSTYAALTGGKQYNINGGTTTAVVTNRKDCLAAIGKSMSVTLSGGEWSIVENAVTPAETSRDLKASEITADLNLQADLNVKEIAALSERTFTVTGTSTIKAVEGKTLTIKKLDVAKGITATIAAGAEVIVPNASVDEVAFDVKGTLINNGTLTTPELGSAVSSTSDIKKFNISIASGATLTNNAIIGGTQNTQAAITVKGNLDNAKGIIYGTNNITDAESYKKGTVSKFLKIKTNKAGDISEFAGATEIEATGNVTTIPQNVNIKFTTEACDLDIATAGNYGELTFTADAGIKSSATANEVIISKITISSGVTLTVDKNNAGNTFICNDLVNNSGLTNSNGKLLKSDKTTPWS